MFDLMATYFAGRKSAALPKVDASAFGKILEEAWGQVRGTYGSEFIRRLNKATEVLGVYFSPCDASKKADEKTSWLTGAYAIPSGQIIVQFDPRGFEQLSGSTDAIWKQFTKHACAFISHELTHREQLNSIYKTKKQDAGKGYKDMNSNFDTPFTYYGSPHEIKAFARGTIEELQNAGYNAEDIKKIIADTDALSDPELAEKSDSLNVYWKFFGNWNSPKKQQVWKQYLNAIYRALGAPILLPPSTASKVSAQRGIFYHGTSITNLHAILKQGLIPNAEKNWNNDPDAGLHAPGRQSYGGIYCTHNIMTAYGAPRDKNDEGRLVIVAMELQPSTFILDEDTINLSQVSKPLENSSDIEVIVVQYYLAAISPTAEPASKEWAEKQQANYIERCLRQWKYTFSERKQEWRPELEAKLREQLPAMWIAAMARNAAHMVHRSGDYALWDYQKGYNEAFPDATYDQIPPREGTIPSIAEAEQAYQVESDKLTRTMRGLTIPPKNETFHQDNGRVMEPITYRGSNKIIAVVEVRDSRKYRGEDYAKPAQLIVHFGSLPEDFIKQWSERVGKNFVVENAKRAASKQLKRTEEGSWACACGYIISGYQKEFIICDEFGSQWVAKSWSDMPPPYLLCLHCGAVIDRKQSKIIRYKKQRIDNYDLFKTSNNPGNDVYPDGPIAFFDDVENPHSIRPLHVAATSPKFVKTKADRLLAYYYSVMREVNASSEWAVNMIEDITGTLPKLYKYLQPKIDELTVELTTLAAPHLPKYSGDTLFKNEQQDKEVMDVEAQFKALHIGIQRAAENFEAKNYWSATNYQGTVLKRLRVVSGLVFALLGHKTAAADIWGKWWVSPTGVFIPAKGKEGGHYDGWDIHDAEIFGFKNKGKFRTKGWRSAEDAALDAGYARVVIEPDVAYLQFGDKTQVEKMAGEIIRRIPLTVAKVEVEWSTPTHGYQRYSSLAEAEERFQRDGDTSRVMAAAKTASYTAYVLTAPTRTKLLETFPPKFPDVMAHHTTVQFGVPRDASAPAPAKLKVVGYVCDESLEAAVVEVDGSTTRPDGGTYHITLSLDRSKGRKPVDSNKVVQAGWNPTEPFDIETIPQKLAKTAADITLPAGIKLYRGVGEDIIHPASAGFDGCLWFAPSKTIARSYIPTAGLQTYIGLRTLCSAPDQRSGLAGIHKQLGCEFTDVQYDSGGRARSYRTPAIIDQLTQDTPYPNKEEFDEDKDAYYSALENWRKVREQRFKDWMVAKLKEYGYEPEEGGLDPYYKLKITLKNGQDELLPNKFQEGTLLIFETTAPLKMFDMTEGGRVEGDLMEPDYYKSDEFRRLAEQGYDAVKINDFAQVEGHGNMGHVAIGVFPNAVSKVKEVNREMTTHPEDFYADYKKYGSSGSEVKIKKMVEDGGGQFISVSNDWDVNENWIWFNDPVTGSTLVLTESQFSVEAVKNHLEQCRREHEEGLQRRKLRESKTAESPSTFPNFKKFVQQHGDIRTLINHLSDAWTYYEEEVREVEPKKGETDEQLYDRVAFNDLKWRYEACLKTFQSWQFPLTVYRAMSLKSLDSLRPDGVGIFWTPNPDTANVYWDNEGGVWGRSRGDDYILKAIVNSPTDINWDETLFKRLNPNRGEDEDEIQLNPGATLQLESGIQGQEYWNGSKKWTRLNKTVTASSQTYYHASKKELPEGFVLNPQPLPTSPEYAGVNQLLEKCRPTNALPREKSVYMVIDPEALKQIGYNRHYLYEVEPIGKVESNDVAYYHDAVSHFNNPDGSPEDATEDAQNYWSGKPHWNKYESGMEYRAPQAKVIRPVEQNKIASHYDEDGFWAGSGGGASGILPVCPQKGTVCLAWRSANVHMGDCWGTIGGAVNQSMSPGESAKQELAEEVGYTGGMNLIPAYVFSSGGGFKYHNFIGVVSTEFGFHPQSGESSNIAFEDETDRIEWIPYYEVLDDMQKNASDYHPGLLKLFSESQDKIEQALQIHKTGTEKIKVKKNPKTNLIISIKCPCGSTEFNWSDREGNVPASLFDKGWFFDKYCTCDKCGRIAEYQKQTIIGIKGQLQLPLIGAQKSMKSFKVVWGKPNDILGAMGALIVEAKNEVDAKRQCRKWLEDMMHYGMKVLYATEESKNKTGAMKNPALDEFMRDLWSQTSSNPFNHRERVWQDKICIECSPFNGRIHLSYIRTLDPKKGFGAEGIKFLCDLADKHEVGIELEADRPHGTVGPGQKKLISWYQRFGFRPGQRGSNYLTRDPEETLKLKGDMKVIDE